MDHILYRVWIPEIKAFKHWGFLRKAFLGLPQTGLSLAELKARSRLYSGMNDKKGTEIYDGSIAKSVYGVGRVFWDDQGFRFELDTDITGLWEMCTGKEGEFFEVIGSTDETPDLY